VIPDPERIDNYFLWHLLHSYDVQCRIRRYATPGAQQVNINATNLGKVLVPVPVGPFGLDEQREIAAILEKAEETIQTRLPMLDRLQALKQSLMHDLLTGKVRTTALIEQQVTP
jgi:type I restriction enzyme S subunit